MDGLALNLASAHLLRTTKHTEMAGKVIAVFGGDGSGYFHHHEPAAGIFPYWDMPKDGATDADVKSPRSLHVYDHYAHDTTYEDMAGDRRRSSTTSAA